MKNHLATHTIRIKEVETHDELMDFIRFPFKLYRKNPWYVPPLISEEIKSLSRDKNPAFEYSDAKYWLAYKDKEIVGRIAGIINHNYNQKSGIRYISFGWLDFVDDEQVLRLLMEQVISWGRQFNPEYIHGPIGFMEFDASGILVEGFDQMPTAYGKYNYPYYPQLMEKVGFTKEVDWVEYNIILPDNLPQKLLTFGEVVAKRQNLHYADTRSKKRILKYADGLFELLNAEYESIFGFTCLTQKQVEDLKKHFLPLLQLRYVAVVLNADDKVVGFGICLPSLSKALQKAGGKLFPFGFLHIQKALYFNDTLDSLLIAIHQDYKHKGVNAMIFSRIWKAVGKNGFTNMESTRQLENNKDVLNLWNKFEYRQNKRARCYIKRV
jgi:GNAT superfamily N-acetyltransferase